MVLEYTSVHIKIDRNADLLYTVTLTAASQSHEHGLSTQLQPFYPHENVSFIVK